MTLKSYALYILLCISSNSSADFWKSEITVDSDLGRIGIVTSVIKSIEGNRALSLFCYDTEPTLFISSRWGSIPLEDYYYVTAEAIVDENNAKELNWLTFNNSVPIGKSEVAHELPDYLLRWLINGLIVEFTVVYAKHKSDSVQYREQSFNLVGFTRAYRDACNWHPDYEMWKLRP